MNLSKKNLRELVTERARHDTVGILSYSFTSGNWIYKFRIIEGRFLDPFLMVAVSHWNADKQKVIEHSSQEMIADKFLNVKTLTSVFRELKNEIK